MEISQNAADSYSIAFAKRVAGKHSRWSTVHVVVYDDGTDLVLFVKASEQSKVTEVVAAFDTVTPMSPYSPASNSDDGTIHIMFANNPNRGEILLAIEAAIRALELTDYQVSHRVNNWN